MTDYTRKKNPYKNFIEFLDSYQEKKNLSYIESISLTKTIQTNYQNHYFPYFIYVPLQSTNTSTTHINDLHKFTIKPEYTLDSLNTNQYLSWQKEHETNIDNYSFDSFFPENIKKQKIEIPIVKLRNIGDILSILNEYPYSDKNEYNIDLKSLQNIREELELLNGMIGMESIKKSILQQMIYFIQHLHIVSSSTKNTNDYKHTILTGPPGTGKTEMAKIIGKMYSKLGILKKNIFKKVTRNDLVAGYLGQTAIKTRKVIEECLGGVLFLDEAYSLGTEDSFSKECVDTLCEALSDHRDDLMMIIAGYENELNETFFKINAGMNSRFMWRFAIESYKPQELMGIFEKKMLENGWEYIEGFMNNKKKEDWFIKHKTSFTHYGRDMELLFSYTKISHAQRIFGKDVSLRKKLTEEDLEDGFQLFLQNKNNEIKIINHPPFGMYV
jgi:hypothetical protein